MTKRVRGADGRMWTLHGRMEWVTPASMDDFEHDVAASSAPGIAMLVLLVALVVALVVWTPSQVDVPSWLIFLIVLMLIFFPIRWIFRRPWSLVANTPGNHEDESAERWVGTVRGMFSIRTITAKVARDIEVYSMPNIEGPLHPVE
jgi:hypothetical protein